MSKQFFAVIGDQLCSLKNSPFTRIGEKKQKENDEMLRSNLSYNPDRLFNKQKYPQSMQAIEDQDFVQLKKMETMEEQRIQFQMLKEATKQDFQKRLKELKDKSDQMKSVKKVYSIFRTPRTICELGGKCAYFRGNFNRHPVKIPGDSGKPVEFLSCLSCKYPMNAHLAIKSHNSMKTQIWNYLKTKNLTQQHINMPYYLLSFKVQEEKSIEQEMYNLIELFQRIKISTYSYKVVEKWDFEMGLLQSKLLINGQNLGLVEASLRLAQCIKQHKKWKGVKVDPAYQQNLNVLKKINLQLRSRYVSELKQRDSVVLLLIKSDSNQPFISNYYKNLFQSLEEYIKQVSLLYLPETRQQSLLLTQLFFPEEYTLNKRLFLLPRSQSQQDFYKLKDILNYNNYSIFFENVNNIRRDKVQNLLKFLSFHEMNYIMGKQIVNQNISKLNLIYATKAGSLKLDHYGKIPNFIEVQSEVDKQKMVNQLFLQYSMGQRCFIILRPFIVGSGLQEIIVNLLRINNFIIIKRVRGLFSTEHATYLATLEHIQQKDTDSYVQFMTSGQCQLILVSKKSAIYQVHALLNQPEDSLSNINPRWIRERPTIQVKKGRQTYIQQIELNNQLGEHELFVAANSLFSIQRCLFGQEYNRRSKVLENAKTGQLLKVQELKKEDNQLKATLRQKQQILWQLRSETFNFMSFNSKSDKSTQDLVSIFFPECTMFQSVVLIVKPSYVYLLDEIKKSLSILKYHTIFSKMIQLSKRYAQQLVQDQQKIKIDSASIRQISQYYHNQKAVFLCLSKISARKQMLSLLSNFSFLPNKTIVQHEKCQQLLKEVLVPIWNHQEKYLAIFNRGLSNLEQAVDSITNNNEELKKQQRLQMIEYFIGSIFGIKYEEDGSSVLGKLSLYSSNEQLSKYQSWYYSTISNIYPSLVPLLFQYRTYGQQTLVIQTNCGVPFMSCIINQYLDEKAKLQKHYTLYPQRSQSNKRNSLVLLIWAKKIFNFIEQISTLSKTCKDIPIQLEGWGNISYINNQYRGQSSGQSMMKQQIAFLESIIKKYANNRYIVANCQKMLSSRIISQKYKHHERRLLPRLSQLGFEQSIRVVERELINKLFLKDKYEMIDPNNQRSNLEKDLLQLNLYRVTPYIGTKYELLVEFILYLQQLKAQSLEHSQVFIDMLSHIKGFLQKYQDLQFLEYQIYLKSLIKLMKEEKNVDQLKVYPNLRKYKNKLVNNQEQQTGGTGKKRKHLQQNQYFKGTKEFSDDYIQEMTHLYSKFNMKTLDDPMQNHILNKNKDTLHEKWMKQENVVNLLRQKKYTKDNRQVQGIFVQYETVNNENEQKIKRKLFQQIEKMDNRNEDTILKQNGLDKQLWYRKVKQGYSAKKTSKVQDAIAKQLQKLNQFKSSMSQISQK